MPHKIDNIMSTYTQCTLPDATQNRQEYEHLYTMYNIYDVKYLCNPQKGLCLNLNNILTNSVSLH